MLVDSKGTSMADDLRKFAKALEQSPSSVVITDRDGNIEYVNPRFCEITGYRPTEVLGKRPSILKSGKTSEAEYRRLWETITSGREWVGEFLNRKKCGDLYWETATISPIRDDDGRITHYVAVKEDITLRKHYEEGLRRTIDELSRSNAALEHFAYVAAHDLQEPLRAMVSFTQLLERRFGDKLDEAAREDLRLVVQNAKLMKTRVSDLLEYSRVHSAPRSTRSVDCNELVKGLLADLEDTLTRTGGKVSSDRLPLLMGDPAQLQLVFRHLIDNALKFQHPDRAPLVHLSAEATADGSFRFSVKDNGIGVAPEYAERIFIMFKRLHTQEAYPGTGIGLAICKRIIERHKGAIWVEANPDGGSIFRFTLGRPEER